MAVILFKSLANLALYKIERNFIYDLYRELSRRLYVDYRNRGLGFIKSSNSAVLARNVNVVCLTFVTGVLMPVAAMASEAVLFALLFGSLAIYNPLVALLTLAIFVPSVALYYYLVRQRLNRYGEEENRAQRRKSRTVIETFRGYADLEIAGAYPAMLSDFDRSMDEIIRVRQRNATIAALPPMFTEVGLAVGMAVLVAFCAGTDNTQMKLLFGIFAVAALRIMPSVRSIMGAWTSLRYNRYTIDVLRDARLYDTPAGIDTTQERMPFEREIRIEGLSFHFDDAPDRDILHDLSLTIRKGERIGIRGASGVGKTTLFNILLGFYRPTAGRITIDGRPLDETNLRKWQNTIGYVSQSVFIADSSFMQNVALGCAPDRIDRRRAAQALETAKLKEFIDTLPQGMETPIGECGCRLSGGQRQRLGIARALYKQADILFFDEATSALDPNTTHAILQLIREINRKLNITVVVITHQMSVVEEICDHVAILDNGTVAEEGTVGAVFSAPRSAAAKRLVFPNGADDAVCDPEKERRIRLVFNGADMTGAPLIATMAVRTGVLASIIAASTRSLDGQIYGTMLLGVPAGEDAARAMEFLRGYPDIFAEEVTENV